MGLFNIGKKKDDNIDEYVVREDTIVDHKDTYNNLPENSDNQVKDEESTTEEENISDYIDPDDLNYESYEDIVDAIETNGWTRMSSVASPITIFDMHIVSIKPTKMGSYDTILEIECPLERIIAICGSGECDVTPDDFCTSPNFYQTPHFFTLRCTNNDNIDISPTTIIDILKSTRDGKLEKYYQEFYGDLSPIADGKLKKKEERYYFAETIVLQDGEKLIFRVHNPNIDISKIDLLMMSDLFEKSEE